ncbi:uncharacterized protein LOC129305421 [Prosopis cineraria]|uniref:uncharacterized protein LOC129305421 n=1 Tax=Prosopis cineraria TaxID=364024 RepID=UPI00240F3173|nr:uncharacterized protein LOC129305421 [Prosopis cineraria]
MPHFRLVDKKACHFPVEIENKAYWAIKKLYLDLHLLVKERFLQMKELEELRLDAYESFRIYKEKTRVLYDKMILRNNFKVGNLVLIYKTRYIHKYSKLTSKWHGPYVVTNVLSYVVLQLKDKAMGSTWEINGHLCKLYTEADPTLQKEEDFSQHVFEPP